MELNYKHLHYFWVVAKEGGITRAAERLGISPQTISGQLSTLEREIGRALFHQVGRRLELTEAGREALRYADEIFMIGRRLQAALADPELGATTTLTIGVVDSVAKLVAYKILEPLMQQDKLRLVCHEGSVEELMLALARHKLDVVLSDRDPGQSRQLNLTCRRVAGCPVGIFAVKSLLDRLDPDRSGRLPEGAPLLLPSQRSSLRARLDVWLDAHAPTSVRIVGEFDDSALLKTFGAQGAGYFPAASVLKDALLAQYGAELVCMVSEIGEDYYLLSYAARLPNVSVEKLVSASAEVMEKLGGSTAQ
ncbi:LysR family transcriptional regulator [Parachitinimonas caeni]|uniref:LysR family transcriptional regulator n=1 Tax=Parachitinimonas caeni TaxID=3031301 RepID=A0ABT7DR49_9NEIS|nr:LysR family transcriptional regulator [Parachitinimonas caeni]MDK2122550.1 LysR family transcriptional regulator [Parachitinimonas caeni]